MKVPMVVEERRDLIQRQQAVLIEADKNGAQMRDRAEFLNAIHKERARLSAELDALLFVLGE